MAYHALFNVLTTVSLIGGLLFLLVGALGVLRLPDVYLRMIAASKCITLGISGMLLAAVFHFIVLGTDLPDNAVEASTTSASAVAASTKAILVIIFQFVAAPIATFMLARSAHIDGVAMWQGTLSDDLHADTAAPPAEKGTGTAKVEREAKIEGAAEIEGAAKVDAATKRSAAPRA